MSLLSYYGYRDGVPLNQFIRNSIKFAMTVLASGSAICFAFGQTGAGKTYTLMGTKQVAGVYQMAAEDLFAVANCGKYRDPLQLWASYYEIYCGHLFDLLNKRKRWCDCITLYNNLECEWSFEFQLVNYKDSSQLHIMIKISFFLFKVKKTIFCNCLEW